MPSPDKYHARWQRNRALAERSASVLEDDADWEIVFRFYASVHLVEGFMRTKPERFWSEDHTKRKLALRESPEVKAGLAPYRDLEDLSRDVRYDPGFVPNATHFANAKEWASKVESVFKSKLESRLTHHPQAPPSKPPST